MMSHRTIGSLAVAALSVLSLMMCSYIWVPEWIADQHRFVQSHDYLLFLSATRASLASLLGSGIAAVGALAAIATVVAAHRTYRSSQDKYASDVLAKSAELLGSVEISTRLGGIYALRRLARTSPEDYMPALDILTGYVRMKYPASSDPVVQSETRPGASRCPVDVHTILSILGERCWKSKEQTNENHDLSYVRLEDAWCVRCDFSGIFFWEAVLDNVNFSKADLRGADFTRARIINCNFEGARLQGAVFNGAHVVAPVGLSQAMLNQTAGDSQTRLPAGLMSPPSWK